MSTVGTGVESLLRHSGTRRSLIFGSAIGALAISTGVRLHAIGAQTAAFDGGTQIDGTQTFAGGTYATTTSSAIYQYAQDTEGKAYVNSYDGQAWTGWTGYDDQPTEVAYQLAPVTYDDKGVLYYVDKSGALYEQGWDSYDAATWTDLSGDYSYGAAPHANVYEDAIHLYGAGTDGYVYHKAYEGSEWGTWAPVNDTPAKGGAKPYSVSWQDHENVFWLGEDDYIYWNRYDYATQEWTGAKQIPSEYGFLCAPHAVGYEPESSLYAYSANADGGAVYNVFDGSAWAGWQPFDAGWTATYAPSAYVYNDEQHIVYTDDSGKGYHTSYGEGGWAPAWEDLGGNYGYDTDQYEYDGALYLTYTGDDGAVYYKTYGADGGGVEPTPTPKVKY